MNYFDNSLILCGLCEKPLRALRLKHVFALLAGVVFISVNSFAQLDTAIVRTFGGPYYEEGRQIIECTEGGYAIIGTTGSDQLNNTNFYLLRLDEELNCLWSQNYGGAEVEWGYSIVEDANNNLLVCGYTNSFGEGGYDILVYKVDPLGNILWQKTYGGSDWDFAYKMIAHPTEGYLICGKTYSYGNGGSDAYLLHISEDGNLINEWTYGGEGDDEFRDMDVFDEGSFLIGGFKYNTESSSVKGCLKIISLEGLELLDYLIPTPSSSIKSVAVNNEYIYYCGDWTTSMNFQCPHFGIISSEGVEIFNEVTSFDGDFVFTSIAKQENDVALCGYTNAFGSGDNNGLLYNRAPNGAFLSGISIGATKLEFYNGIVSLNRYIITGQVINDNAETEQLPIMVYPDFTFSASSYTEWNNESCFTIDLNEIPGELDQRKIVDYSIYTLGGNYINNISKDDFESEFEIVSERQKSLLVSNKSNFGLLICIPNYKN